MDKKELKLNDQVIAHIGQSLQLSLLTGTDIVDRLRSLVLTTAEDGSLMVHPSHQEAAEREIQELIDRANEMTAEDIMAQSGASEE